MTELKVQCTVYRGWLCIETLNPDDEAEDFSYPNRNGRLGCVLVGTEGKLGLSKEAAEWLREIKPSRDCIGDVDVWMGNDPSEPCFGWLGGRYCIRVKEGTMGSRDYDFDILRYETVPNKPPWGAQQAVDRALKRKELEEAMEPGEGSEPGEVMS